jgi:chromosome segregation and condensation protein ScpB
MVRHKPAADGALFDRELSDLPPEARWREWMNRVEGAIFACGTIVPRDVLAGLVGREVVLDDLIADIRLELKARPYDLIPVAGGWQHRTRARFADVIRQARGERDASNVEAAPLFQLETLVLAAIAYHQPVPRERISQMLGREISRDTIARLKRLGLIGAGPRLPQIGAALTYVTTPGFLDKFGLNSLRDLPELERLDGGTTAEEPAALRTDLELHDAVLDELLEPLAED